MCKILVIDDEPDLLNLTKTVLELDTHTVYTAKNVDEAMYIIAETKFNLIILDVKLHGSEVHDVCRRFKQNPSTRDTCILLYSASVKEEELLENKLVNGYIMKPFKIKDLLSKVNQLQVHPAREMAPELIHS